MNFFSLFCGASVAAPPKMGIRDMMPGCAPGIAGSPYGCSRDPPSVQAPIGVKYTPQEVLREPSGSGYGKIVSLFYAADNKAYKAALGSACVTRSTA